MSQRRCQWRLSRFLIGADQAGAMAPGSMHAPGKQWDRACECEIPGSVASAEREKWISKQTKVDC